MHRRLSAKAGVGGHRLPVKVSGHPTLYGTGIGIQGRKLKSQIAKQAAANAERLYEAIVEQRQAKVADPRVVLTPASDLVFDPTQPKETDWEQILSKATEDIVRKQRRRQKDN